MYSKRLGRYKAIEVYQVRRLTSFIGTSTDGSFLKNLVLIFGTKAY